MAPINGTGGDDTLVGGPGNNTINGFGGNDSINGNDGNDDIDGGFGNDTINGGAGRDFIDGWTGDDSISGGGGADTIFGYDGNDTIRGNGGNDDILGEAGNDELYGNGGHDFIDGGAGHDFASGGAGNDLLLGGGGRDTLEGNGGADEIWAGGGNDVASGGAGNDYVDGGFGNDMLSGDAGDDTIDGWVGDDTMDGGAGDDRLRGYFGNDVAIGGAGNDTINGEQGYDAAVFGGSIFDYSLGSLGTAVTVTDNNASDGDDGTDIVRNTEELRFSDHTYLVGANNGPILLGGDQSTDEETATAFAIDAYDFDGDAITLDSITYSGLGVLTLVSTTALSPSIGSGARYGLSFDPNGQYENLGVGETAVETVSVQVSDGNGGVQTLTFDITINGVNDPPVANDDTATTDEDTAVIISVLANDTDVDGDSLTVTSASALNGTVAINGDGTLTYTGNADFNGSDTITYEISDGNGGTDTATVAVTVNPVNDPPVAADDTATTDEDTAVIISVLANDTDVDGDSLTVTTASAANGGVVINLDGTLTYTPNADFNGTDTITYTISDGNGGTDSASVTVTVNPVNDPPVANDDTATTDEDTAVIVSVLANDTDVDGDSLTVTSASAANGGVVINLDGTLTYTPNADFNGTDTISYEISDGNGLTDTATVTVTVNAVNDDPVANDDTAETDEDTAVTINVLANDTDVDGDSLTVTTASATNGGVVINLDGTLTYTPNTDYFGTDTITYAISDGNGGTDTASVTVTVNQTTPVAGDDTATTDEDTQIDINVLANDTDPGGSALTVVSASAVNGTVIIRPNGELRYIPDANFNGSDTITYTVRNAGGAEDTATVSVTVNPVNDAPDTAAANDPAVTSNEVDGPATVDLIGRASDIDGDAITVVSARFIDPATGDRLTVPVTLVNGQATFDPADFGLDDGETLNVQLEYFVEDNSGAANDTSRGVVDVTINGAGGIPPGNQAPTADVLDLTAGPNIDEAAGDITFDLAPVTDDLDGDPLTVIALVGPDGSELSYTQIGETIVVDPAQFGLGLGESGLFELTYIIDDGSGAANSQASSTILFNLDGADDAPPPPPDNIAPTANDLSLTANEVDGDVTVDLNGEVSDADGDGLTISAVRVLGGATLDFTLESGVLVIDPASLGLNDGEFQTVTLEYDVEDDSGQSNNTSTGTITLDVTGFTEAPPPGPDTQVLMDFEPFASDSGSEIPITTYEGFIFEGLANVIETDEIGGGRGGVNGIQLGQTTPGGDNVLLSGATTTPTEVPVLDEFGNPVLDERGQPVTEIQEVVDEYFRVYSPDSTYRIEDTEFNLGIGARDTPPPLPAPTEFSSIGDAFSLDAISLNLASGVTAVTINTYNIVVNETPLGDPVTGTLSQYAYDYALADSFVFNLDGATAALELDLNSATFADAVGNTNIAAFDDIYAFEIIADDGSVVVLDDILITL